jgi:hypothetical protein
MGSPYSLTYDGIRDFRGTLLALNPQRLLAKNLKRMCDGSSDAASRAAS